MRRSLTALALLASTTLLAGVVAPLSQAATTDAVQPQIIKGELATSDPGVASLLWAYTKQGVWSQYVYCTGTVVHPQFVLTAQHCIDQQKINNPERLSVRVNSIKAYEGGQNIKFDRWIFREGHDIALLHLAEPIKDPKVVQLATTGPEKNEQLRVFGFGMTVAASNGVTSNELRTATVTVDRPSGAYDYFSGPAYGTLAGSGSASHGDSGGPQFNAQGVQVGVGSTAVVDMGIMNYAAVAESRQWILDTIAKEAGGQ